MIAFIKSQTPDIDMDPPYREVRITPPGEYLQEMVPEIHHLSIKTDFSQPVEVIVQENQLIPVTTTLTVHKNLSRFSWLSVRHFQVCKV